MKIGLISCVHTTVLKHCVADLAWGFSELGHEVEVLDENGEWCAANGMDITPEEFSNFIDDFKPESLIQFDGLRGNHALLIPPEIPFVSWIMDRLPWLCNSEIASYCLPNDRILFMFDEFRSEFIEKWRYPAAQCHTMHMGVNTRVYGLEERPRDDRFDVDIAFVTRLNSQMPRSRMDSRMAAARVAIETGKSVGLYGVGWDEHEEFKPYFRGVVEPGAELCACYQQARLHVHANEDTNWHMRTLECVSSGGRIACHEPGETIRSYPYPYCHPFRNAKELTRIFDAVEENKKDGAHSLTSFAQHEWTCQAHSYEVRARQIIELAKPDSLADLPF